MSTTYYACMPLQRNVPEGRPEWQQARCPQCNAACWRSPLIDELAATVRCPVVALCTTCSLRKGSKR